MEIRVFKAEKNTNNKSYFAVIGAKTEMAAIEAVIRKKKENMNKVFDYTVWRGVIAPYKDGLDGLWKRSDRKTGTPCHIVWKE